MSGLIQYDGQNGFGKRLQTIDQQGVPFRPVYDQSVIDAIRPISININVGRDDKSDTRSSFSFLRSKFVWLLVTLAISSGLGYARSRSVCQGFKDSGKFYYGMDVSRCVNIVIKQPLSTIEQHLASLNNRY